MRFFALFAILTLLGTWGGNTYAFPPKDTIAKCEFAIRDNGNSLEWVDVDLEEGRSFIGSMPYFGNLKAWYSKRDEKNSRGPKVDPANGYYYFKMTTTSGKEKTAIFSLQAGTVGYRGLGLKQVPEDARESVRKQLETWKLKWDAARAPVIAQAGEGAAKVKLQAPVAPPVPVDNLRFTRIAGGKSDVRTELGVIQGEAFGKIKGQLQEIVGILVKQKRWGGKEAVWWDIGPDAGYISAVIQMDGKTYTINSWYPKARQSPNIAVSETHGLVSVKSLKERQEVESKNSAAYKQIVSIFDFIPQSPSGKVKP